MLGKLFRARAHSWPSRAKKVAYSALRRGALKPTTPMLAPKQQPLKPTTPLHPETAPKTLVSRPQRRWRFQSYACTHKQRRWWFQTSALPVAQSHRQARRPGPGCSTRGRRRGLAGLRDDAPSEARGAAPNDWRPPRGLRGLAAVPVGGGRARAGLEIDHSEPPGSRVAISRAGRRPSAHTAARHTKAGHAAPGTPVGPQATRSRPAPQGPGGSRIRPLGGSQRLFQRICVPAAPRRSQASTTRAAMPASADLPHVRGSYCFLMPTSPSILRTPS